MRLVSPRLLLAALLVLSARSAPSRPEFYDPRILGGEMLNNASRHGGEPLNVIISGFSTPSVLTTAGFLGFAASLGFARECFGLHRGDRQPANLGDGNGWVDEMMVLRESYGSASLGPCWESVTHRGKPSTDGSAANSGALFLAVSQEESILSHHRISRDGYNIGRDLLVQHAARTTSFKGVKYMTTASRIDDLMIPGKQGINHNITIDGVVVLLTVTVVPSIDSLASKHIGLIADYFSLLFFVHTTYCMQNIWTIW
ncbi:hypothetical protein DFH08DRAFT_952846 [Mycena albidolilacea]|uniref:Uncharacterized protein n=1 Tax=Mycena albidolilacea TaxID=1033008 RepID=A0AAD7F0D0_9AGAR|nr:hypothetical protein DFH08DRAFT_952846 [Mycena albidolilacea]